MSFLRRRFLGLQWLIFSWQSEKTDNLLRPHFCRARKFMLAKKRKANS